MTSGVRITGLNKTVRALERLGVETADLKQVFTRVGDLVINEAKSLAPVKSGRLANSIRGSKSKNKAVIRAGSARVPYAGVVHYGGGVGAGQRGPHNIQPHPFLTGAVQSKQEAAVQEMEEGLHSLIRKHDLA